MKLHPTWEKQPAEVRFALAADAVVKDVRAPAFLVLDRLQHLPAHKQMLALTAALAIMANAIGQDPHELITQVRRMVREAGLIESSADALSDYAKGELRR